MNWLKSNSRLLIMAPIFLVMVGIGIWLLRESMQEEQKWRGVYEAKLKERDDLTRRPPPPRERDWVFPVIENRRVLMDNQSKLNELVRRLASELGHSSARYAQIPGSAFSRIASNRVQQLLNRASVTHVRVPQGFGFGFYYYARGVFPHQANTPALQQQLEAVETVANILMDAKVSSIDHVLLVELPAEAGQKVGLNIAAPPVPEIFTQDVLGIVSKRDAAFEYQLIPFEFAFRCDTETLRAVLNKLVSSKKIFLISTVDVATEKSAAAWPTEDEEPTDEEKPPSKQYIYGSEKLRVKMLVYLLDFTMTRS